MINRKIIAYFATFIIAIALIVIFNPLENVNFFNEENLAEVVQSDKGSKYRAGIVEIDRKLDELSKENKEKSIEQQYEINNLLRYREGLESQIQVIESPYFVQDFNLKVLNIDVENSNNIELDTKLINLALKTLTDKYAIPDNTKVIIEEQSDIYYVHMYYGWSEISLKDSVIATVEIDKETQKLIKHYQGRISNIGIEKNN